MPIVETRGKLGTEGVFMSQLAAGPKDNIRRVVFVAVNENPAAELHKRGRMLES